MTARLHFYVRTSAGLLGAEGTVERDGATVADLLALVGSDQPMGYTVLDADDPTAVRPPAPPAPADPLAPKRERIGVLRAKGWAQLTLVEQAEARALAFDLGGIGTA